MEDLYKYGVPEQKKFPMPDADHVRSAIRFFNYVDPRYEKELASAILRRMKEYGLSFDDFTVGEENRFSKYVPESALQHHGILGQKWGVRRFQNSDGSLTEAGKQRYFHSGETSTGNQYSIKEMEPGKLAKFLQRHSDRIKNLVDRTINADIFDKDGNKIGDLQLFDEGDKSLNVTWIGIDDDQRGKGYASSVMKDTIQYAKDKGYRQITLEVPGNSPDARHIYEKLGFKAGEKISDDDDVWGGLTKMRLQLDELQHHGILGQKWGVRRYQNEDGSLTPAGKRRLERKDNRWIKRNASKIHNKAYKKSQREMRKVTKQLDRKYIIRSDSERNGRRYMNEYNQNLARIMNTKVENIAAPSGRVVKFVAKRGEYGVHTALADQGYDMNKVKSGIWDDGRVAYKSEKVEKR